MITLDASVIIGYLDFTDSHHEGARAIFAAHPAENFAVHPLTLAEVLVSAARTGSEGAMFDDITALGIHVQRPPDRESLELARLRAQTGLRMPDCCVLVTAQHEAGSLATFDTTLARAARALGLTVLS